MAFHPTNIRTSPGRLPEQGSILISVIWMLSLLAIFTLAVNRQASQELFLGKWLKERTLTRAAAKAGVERALLELQTDSIPVYDATTEHWAVLDKAFKDRELGQGRFTVVCDPDQGFREEEPFRYGLCDEAARINVNRASEDVLRNLFLAVQRRMTQKQAVDLAQAILDWRDGDDAVMTQGAESAHYRFLPEPYEPRNASFESVEELQMVRGIDAKLFALVRPYVTVYTDGKVNLNTAPAPVLQALGLSASLAVKVAAFRKGDDEIEGTDDDRPFPDLEAVTQALSLAGSFSPEDFAQVSNTISLGLASVGSDTFRIHAFGRLIEGSAETLVTCIARRDGTILYWKEGR